MILKSSLEKLNHVHTFLFYQFRKMMKISLFFFTNYVDLICLLFNSPMGVHWKYHVLSVLFAVKRNHDNSTSIDISRANSLTDELDYMSEDIPLPVVTNKAQ